MPNYNTGSDSEFEDVGEDCSACGSCCYDSDCSESWCSISSCSSRSVSPPPPPSFAGGESHRHRSRRHGRRRRHRVREKEYTRALKDERLRNSRSRSRRPKPRSRKGYVAHGHELIPHPTEHSESRSRFHSLVDGEGGDGVGGYRAKGYEPPPSERSSYGRGRSCHDRRRPCYPEHEAMRSGFFPFPEGCFDATAAAAASFSPEGAREDVSSRGMLADADAGGYRDDRRRPRRGRGGRDERVYTEEELRDAEREKRSRAGGNLLLLAVMGIVSVAAAFLMDRGARRVKRHEREAGYRNGVRERERYDSVSRSRTRSRSTSRFSRRRM